MQSLVDDARLLLQECKECVCVWVCGGVCVGVCVCGGGGVEGKEGRALQ